MISSKGNQVRLLKGDTEVISEVTISDGQLLVAVDTGELFLDHEDQRLPIGKNQGMSSLSIGSVVSAPIASASITGEISDQKLNLWLPKGDKGDKGDVGGTFPIAVVEELPVNPISSTLYLVYGSHSQSYDGSFQLPNLRLVKPEDAYHLIVKYDTEGNLGAASTIIDTLNISSSREKVKGFLYNGGNSGEWVSCPASGFGVPFDGTGIVVDLSDIAQSGYIYYAWYGEDDELSDYNSTYLTAVYQPENYVVESASNDVVESESLGEML